MPTFLVFTTRKLSYYGRPIAAGAKIAAIAACFWPTAVHEIYCGVLYARRNSSSIFAAYYSGGPTTHHNRLVLAAFSLDIAAGHRSSILRSITAAGQ